MNKLPYFILSLTTIIIHTSCGSFLSPREEYNKRYSNYDYSLFYKDNINMGKGTELYAWRNNDGIYECGALPGTNRNKELKELTLLQTNYPCPLTKMKEIIDTYSEEAKQEILIDIISFPAVAEDLKSLGYDKTKNPLLENEYSYLYQTLIPDYYKTGNKGIVEFRENWLLTKDKRELFNSFQSTYPLKNMEYELLKQYLGNPQKEETIFLESYPPQFGGYESYYQLYKEKSNEWEVVFIINQQLKINSYYLTLNGEIIS